MTASEPTTFLWPAELTDLLVDPRVAEGIDARAYNRLAMIRRARGIFAEANGWKLAPASTLLQIRGRKPWLLISTPPA